MCFADFFTDLSIQIRQHFDIETIDRNEKQWNKCENQYKAPNPSIPKNANKWMKQTPTTVRFNHAN